MSFLDDDIRDALQEGADFLHGTEVSKTCTLIYPPTIEFCTNCEFLAATGKSSGYHKTGGPIPFPAGSLCPLCNGAGTKEVEQSEDIELRLVWINQVKTDLNGLPVILPGGLLETRGFVSDIPKILKADELLAQKDLAGYQKWRYKRISDPGDPFSIVKNRYFTCKWERSG